MAEGGGSEPGSGVEPDSEPVPVQAPIPASDIQKQIVGALLKTQLRKGDKW